MNEPEKADSQVNEDIENLQVEVQSLQTMLSVSLMLFLVFTICINLFLGIQTTIIREQVHLSEARENTFITVNVPQMYEFYTKLNDYSSRHPDFRPLFAKYGPFFAEHKFITTPQPK